MIGEFWFSEFAINSVLFQRGLYPPETFKTEQQYGIPLLISEDPQIKDFLKNLLNQSEGKSLCNSNLFQKFTFYINIQKKNLYFTKHSGLYTHLLYILVM